MVDRLPRLRKKKEPEIVRVKPGQITASRSRPTKSGRNASMEALAGKRLHLFYVPTGDEQSAGMRGVLRAATAVPWRKVRGPHRRRNRAASRSRARNR